MIFLGSESINKLFWNASGQKKNKKKKKFINNFFEKKNKNKQIGLKERVAAALCVILLFAQITSSRILYLTQQPILVEKIAIESIRDKIKR